MPAVRKVNPALYLFVLAATLVAVFYPVSRASFAPAARAMAVSSYHGPDASLKAYRAAAPRSYRVHAGDTLSSIAAAQLGSAARWDALWWVNRGHVPNPDEIIAGEDLSLPMASLQGQWLARRALDAVPRPPAPKPVIADESAPAPPSGPAPAPPVSSTGGGGVGGAFGACVRLRENDNSYAWGTGDGGGAYQFEPATWASGNGGSMAGYGTAGPAWQDQVFLSVYAQDGTSPWAPSDGC